ncbi:MAG: HEPN domain-containing protein [Candidatus Nanohaloarchaea archaeon]
MDEEQEALLDASRDKIEVAEHLLDNGNLSDAVSRAYYGMFHAARAALIEEGSRPKTHQGVVSELGRLFRDEFDRELISSMSEIQSLREDADYEPYFEIDEDVAEDSVGKAWKFFQQVKIFLSG